MQILNRDLIGNPYNWGIVLLMIFLGNMFLAVIVRSATGQMAASQTEN